MAEMSAGVLEASLLGRVLKDSAVAVFVSISNKLINPYLFWIQVQKTCGWSTNKNCTYFISPSYPKPYLGGDVCSLSVWPCGDNVCQLRLDFIDFNLAPPDANGNCLNDFFLVSGGGSSVPRICGLNTGEHGIVVD